MDKLLDVELEHIGVGATRKVKSEAKSGSAEVEEESILKKQHKDVKAQSHHTDKKIIKEYTVTGKE